MQRNWERPSYLDGVIVGFLQEGMLVMVAYCSAGGLGLPLTAGRAQRFLTTENTELKDFREVFRPKRNDGHEHWV